MKLEHQVPSLELCKRLKELGYPQESFWSWYETKDFDDTPRLNRTDENCPTCCLPQQSFEDKISAPTVAELGEMLVGRIDRSFKALGKWHCWGKGKKGDILFDSDTEANARAKMMIYLLENKIIKL